MKTNQLIGVIGGALLVVSTVIPFQGASMIQMLGFISFDFLIGFLPIICILCGAVGALMSWKDNAKIALASGALAVVYILVASRFEFAMLFKAIPFLLAFLGAIALIAGGAMGLKK